MERLLLYVNELSCLCDDPELVATTRTQVLATLETVSEVKKVRPDMVLTGPVPLAKLLLGDGTQSLSSILGGDFYKDQWRAIALLDEASPWGIYPGCAVPGALREVTFEGRPAIGMTWAKVNGSLVVSFGYPPNWTTNSVAAQFWTQTGENDLNSEDVIIPNLSAREHVQSHFGLLHDYGSELSASSIIHYGEGFVARMYFNDHPPPHFHVMLDGNAAQTEARFRLDTMDIMEGFLPGGIRRSVRNWAVANRVALATNWERCRRQQHPILLG